MKITERLKVVLKSILSLQMGEVNTDKGNLIWDSENDLEQGMEVFVRDENDEIVAAPDGEYVTEDGKAIVVAEGKVAEIRDPEAEVAPEQEEIEETSQEVQVEAAEEEEAPAPADEPEAEPEAEVSLEDRVAALEERLSAILDGINGIVNAIAELEGRIAEVEGKVAKVEAPAADPIDEVNIEEEKQVKSRLSYMRKK